MAVNLVRRSVCAALLGLMVSHASLPAFAGPEEASVSEVALKSPEQFIEGLVGELKALALAKEAGDTVDMNAVFSRDLAVTVMQRQLLSRSARNGASEEELGKYNDLFPSYIAAVYADSIDRLVSRTIEITEVIERKPGDMIVRSNLRDDAGQVRARIDWRVFVRDDTPYLADVLVEGQSVNVDRRAQFTSIVSRGGFSSLLAHMEEFLATG